jgi:hypothetical protein
MRSVDAKERHGRVEFPYSETLRPIAQQICEVTIISAGNLSACPFSIVQRVSRTASAAASAAWCWQEQAGQVTLFVIKI